MDVVVGPSPVGQMTTACAEEETYNFFSIERIELVRTTTSSIRIVRCDTNEGCSGA